MDPLNRPVTTATDTSEAPGAVDGGTLISVPRCNNCRRAETISLPLTEISPGVYLCDHCQEQRAGGSLVQPATSSGLVGVPPPGAPPAAPPAAPGGGMPPRRQPAPRGSPYETLGVPFDATDEEITAAYEAGMAFWNERRAGPQAALATEKQGALAKAYIVLHDPKKRQEYDEMLRKQAETIRLRRIASLESWQGRQVVSLQGVVEACEASDAGWQTGQAILKNNELRNWVDGALRDIEARGVLEEIMGRPAVAAKAPTALTHELNEALYRLWPDRPFRFFASPDRAQPPAQCFSVSSVEDFVKNADTHWQLAVQHLYNGELVVWLDQQQHGPRSDPADNAVYPTIAAYYQRVCLPFKGTPAAGVGLERLLEFLDIGLDRPNVTIRFDDDRTGYTLKNWDGELPHKPITVTITNTTRGYVAGALTLATPEQRNLNGQIAPVAWVNFDRLPAPPYTKKPVTTYQRPWRLSEANRTFTLQGAGETPTSFTLSLGNFDALRRRRTYTRPVQLKRILYGPKTETVIGAYPISLQLMGFLGGYRLALWRLGLRAGLPAAALDGALAFAATWLFLLLALLFAPHGQWGFFSTGMDYTASGGSVWLVIDAFLIALLRPFAFTLYLFGFALPWIIGALFALRGFFLGHGCGYTQFKRADDLRGHRGFGAFLMWALWLVGASVLVMNLVAYYAPTISLGSVFQVWVLAYYIQHPLITPPDITGFPIGNDALMVVVPGIVAYIIGRIITNVRGRLYDLVERRDSGLLRPEGKD